MSPVACRLSPVDATAETTLSPPPFAAYVASGAEVDPGVKARIEESEMAEGIDEDDEDDLLSETETSDEGSTDGTDCASISEGSD